MKGIDKFRMIINKNIRYIIDYHNIKRSKLANEFNISETTFSHYFNNKAVPTIDFLIKFAEKFAIPLDDLVKKDLSSASYVQEPPAIYKKRDRELLEKEMQLTQKENELLQKEIDLLKKAHDTLYIMYKDCEQTLATQMQNVKRLKNQSGGLLQGKKVDK